MKKIILTAVTALMFGTAFAQKIVETADVAHTKGNSGITVQVKPADNPMVKKFRDTKPLKAGKMVKKGIDLSKHVSASQLNNVTSIKPVLTGKSGKASLSTINATVNKNIAGIPQFSAGNATNLKPAFTTSKSFTPAVMPSHISNATQLSVADMKPFKSVARLHNDNPFTNAKTLTAADIKELTPHLTPATRNAAANGMRKAVNTPQGEYSASGFVLTQDALGAEQFTPTNWTMYSGYANLDTGDQIPAFFNVIPYIQQLTNFYENGIIPVAGTAEGNKITIPQQYIAKGKLQDGTEVYIILFSPANEKGNYNIEMTFDEKGNITTTPQDAYVYAAFTTPTVDPDSFVGNYEYIAEPTYKAVGANADDPGIAGFKSKYHYTGYGNDNDTGENVTWDAYLGKDIEHNVDVLINPIPNPAPDDIDAVSVFCTIDGNTVTILPQVIAATSDYNLIVYGSNTSDGSIVMTIGANGSLQTVAGQQIVYGAFTGNSFDPTFATQLGTIASVNDVRYELYKSNSGGESDIPGFEPMYKYNANGGDYDYDTRRITPVSWKAQLGTHNGQTYIIDLIPKFFEDVEYIPAQCNISGNEVTVQPFTFATTSDGYSVAIFCGTQDDGVIRLTLDEEGHLALANPDDMIILGRFEGAGFTPSYNGFAGYFEAIVEPKYTLEGEEYDPMPGFTKYDASGWDVEFDRNGNLVSQTPVQWTTYLGEGQDLSGDKVDVMVDLIPLHDYFRQGGLDNIQVIYNISSDGNIVVPAQKIAESTDYYFYFFNAANEDGSVRMKLAEDGSLSLTDYQGTIMMYAAFTQDTFDPNYNAGYIEAIVGATYGDGGNTPGGDIERPEGFDAFTPLYIYNATGVEIDPETQRETSVNWKAWYGYVSDMGEQITCLVDIIPNPFASQGLGCIPVGGDQTGNNIVIPGQPVVQLTGQDGSPVYLHAFSGMTEDGSIHYTITKDGKLALANPDDIIIYGVFTTEDFILDEDHYLGAYSVVAAVNYGEGGNSGAPSNSKPKNVWAEPDFTDIFFGMSPSFYSYGTTNFMLLPAFAELPYRNFTKEAVDGFTWSVSELVPDYVKNEYVPVNEQVGVDRDFVMETEGGKIYNAVSLTAYNKYGESEPYRYGQHFSEDLENLYALAGDMGNSHQAGDGTFMIPSRANIDRGLAPYGFCSTPGYAKRDAELNKEQYDPAYDIAEIIAYEGKPAAPLYMEGVNMWVFEPQVADDFELTCELHKCHRTDDGTLVLGDLIAISHAKRDDFKLYNTQGIPTGQINFSNFYTYDIDGLTISHDHLFIEDEFCVVLKGWDNKTFDCYPIGEGEWNEVSLPNMFFKMKARGEQLVTAGEIYSNLYIGLANAAYGYLYTEEKTNVSVAPEGGEVSLSIRPMLFSNTATGRITTRLFLDDNYELPSWVKYSFENEDYNSDEFSFDLKFTVAALPTDLQARETTLRFWQEGAYIDVKIAQKADANAPQLSGIDEIASAPAQRTGRIYNVAGQKVNSSFSGIKIMDGVKVVK